MEKSGDAGLGGIVEDDLLVIADCDDDPPASLRLDLECLDELLRSSLLLRFRGDVETSVGDGVVGAVRDPLETVRAPLAGGDVPGVLFRDRAATWLRSAST